VDISEADLCVICIIFKCILFQHFNLYHVAL